MSKNNKNKNKQQNNNSQKIVVQEFDYDKLAEAIVHAQEESSNKANEKKKFTSDAFAMLTTLTFRMMAILGWLIMGIMPVLIISICMTSSWNGFLDVAGNIIAILVIVLLAVLLFAFSFILWKAGKEIEREKDGNYIVTVFSSVVSFAALIVALIALFKGVG